MESTRRQRIASLGTAPALRSVAAFAAIAAVAALLLAGLASFGIWDPWEVDVADLARRLASGKGGHAQSVGPWLVAQSFRLLGVAESSGRLPIALSGVAMVALAYVLVARFADRRAAIYTVLVAGTSPLFIFNARTMLGEAPTFAIQTAIALCVAMAVLGGAQSARARLAWLLATAALCVVGTAARGALLCVLPPIGAAAVVVALDGRLRARDSGAAVLIGYATCIAALVLAAGVAHAARMDAASYSAWLGGTPEGGQPPSFDAVLERIFHAFAPWSALLPLALLRLVAEPETGEENTQDERRLRLFLLLWAALGYAALTLFLSRYGHKAAVAPVTALAAAVALLLRDLERSRASHWPTAVAALFLSLLVLRDFALYPNSPLHGMPLADFTVPDAFNPKRIWSLVLLPFSVIVLLGLGVEPDASTALDLRAPYRWFAQQWRRGLAFKLWLICGALILLALQVFGLACWLPQTAKRLTTLAIKIGKVLALIPVALPIALTLCQLALHGYARLGKLRALPILAAGLVVGAYSAFGFMPLLSGHFSPREVYETYNKLAAPGETLLEYKVGARAAAYYANGASREVDSLPDLVDQLTNAKRRWAVFPADELAAINHAFRERTNRHLFVADAHNARAVLAANNPVKGRPDDNILTRSVLRTTPTISHKVEATFDDKIMLLGYDLKLPRGDHVGAGDHFEITWYFKALKPIPGSYRIFLHIDSGDMRINGDHDPVDDKYPVRMWSAGDVIADHQTLNVPSTYSAGSYTMYIGFYSGDVRMQVKEGPHDDANRAVAGVLRIR